MKKILSKTSEKLQENTNNMEETIMADQQQSIMYQWIKSERFGDVVTVDNDNVDPKWLNFTDGTRINKDLIQEYLMLVENENQILPVNDTAESTKNVQPTVQNQVEDVQPIVENQVESKEPSIMGKMIMKMSKKNVVNVPLQINISIPTQQLYAMLLEGMEEQDLNEEIMEVALQQIEINNLTEYLKENVSSFLSEYYSDN